MDALKARSVATSPQLSLNSIKIPKIHTHRGTAMEKSLVFSLAFLFLVSAPASASSEIAELRRLVESLSSQVRELTEKVNQLESQREQSTAPPSKMVDPATAPVVLEANETDSVIAQSSGHVLSKPWWSNIDLSGFAATGVYGTGSDGNKEDWGFEIKEATIFVEAAVWEDIDFFLEFQTNRLGDDRSKYTRTGEVYVHFRDVEIGNTDVGFKVGRLDLPFGEEYLWQDAIDNPLIQNSASYPYGWDEGVLAYGRHKELNWIFAITDGNDERSEEDHKDKAINAKFFGDLADNLYLSLSLMRNGMSAESAMEFGGSHFEPVDGSSSDAVDSWLMELNTRYQFTLDSMEGYLAIALGTASQDDDAPGFDRDIHWFTIEPYLSLNPQWYTVLRYSEIGTYDDEEGYHFDGKPFAGGNDAFGYDVERFRRLSMGLGWTPTPRTRIKFEVGNDWYDLIESSVREKGDDRHFIGAEIAVGF